MGLAAEAALVDALRAFPAQHLLEVCAHVQSQTLHAALRPGACEIFRGSVIVTEQLVSAGPPGY